MIALLIIWNLVISVLNAISAGWYWAESKALGGFSRLLAWCGAIMSACGFTWCYAAIVCSVFSPTYISAAIASAIFGMAYIAIIIPVIGTGLVLVANSYINFKRTRSFADGAELGYNVFASIYNISGAYRGVPESYSAIRDLLGGDKDNFPVALMIALGSILAGILTTYAIITTVSKKKLSERRMEFGK